MNAFFPIEISLPHVETTTLLEARSGTAMTIIINMTTIAPTLDNSRFIMKNVFTMRDVDLGSHMPI